MNARTLHAPTRARRRTPRPIVLDARRMPGGEITVDVYHGRRRRGQLLVNVEDVGVLEVDHLAQFSFRLEVIEADWPPAEDARRLPALIQRFQSELEARIQRRSTNR